MGIVEDSNGCGIADVLVERISADWKTCLDETFSDSNGRFGLSQVSQGVYYLKLSKSGFCTLRFKVSV